MTTIAVVDSDTPGTTLIEQTEDTGVVSRSWAAEAIPVEARLNPDAPPALDMRTGSPTHGQELSWAMPSSATWRLMTGSDEGRDVFLRAMVEQGRDVSREV